MKFGIDCLQANMSLADRWGRCGLVSNQSSVTADLRPAWRVLFEGIGDRLVALFGPQHGLVSTVQENMIETSHSKHAPTGLPVYSLYSETREPTAEMLNDIDTLVVDLPVTGCRIYTYKYTMAACLRAARKHGKRVVILDRANPVGGVFVEGNVLDRDYSSFVGEFPIPMRHGLTMGEVGLYFNREIEAELEIVKLEGWDPTRCWRDQDRTWVLTSPNLPTLESTYSFPGTVLLEGTNASEGRGTCLPFLFIGAGYVESSEDFCDSVLANMKSSAGFNLRATEFQPAFHKWSEQDCRGFQIHIDNPDTLPSYRLGISILRAFWEACRGEFAWRQPPYEYEYKKLPIEILFGSGKHHTAIESNNFDINDSIWNEGCERYLNDVQSSLLYERKLQVI